MSRPTGGYVDQMLEPGGWPDADEDVFYDRAREFTRVLHGVADVLNTCLQQRIEVFEGGIWSGGAAIAADGEVGARIDQLQILQDDLAGVITWHDYVGNSIVQAKSLIGDNVETAYRQIDILQNDPALDADERNAAINTVLSTTYGANVGLVTTTAEQIAATKAWRPPTNALPDLLDRQPPPPVSLRPDSGSPGSPRPDAPQQGAPRPETPPAEEKEEEQQPGTEQPAPDAGRPIPVDNTPHSPVTPPPAAAVMPPTGGAVPPATGAPPMTTPPRSPGTSSPPPGIDEVGSVAPPSPAASAPPAAAQPSGAGGRGKGLAPAATFSPPVGAVPTAGAKDDASPSVAPAGATPAGGGAPAGMPPPAAARGAGGGGSGGAVPQRAMGPHPTSRASAQPKKPAAGSGRPEPPDRPQTPDPPAVAAIPVSTARAERDAIAASTAADAEGRSGGPDPLRLARRIAAALNAPDSPGGNDFGFFWVTGVTADGEIVVANSYGLAYIPDGVQLPDPVHMATADESIPVKERARWATYPVIAVQGWAAHRNAVLRAVIATEAQFAESDPGTAKIVLAPDDIPESGEMAGRSRLEVVAPDTAQELADTEDGQLAGLLPPPPAGAGPSPDDQRATEETTPAPAKPLIPLPGAAGTGADKGLMMWLDVMKPMFSSAAGREAAHLRAFHTYTAHAHEAALEKAYNANKPTAKRAAVADWYYWKHLAKLLDAAVGDDAEKKKKKKKK